jgi:hypothetical protein
MRYILERIGYLTKWHRTNRPGRTSRIGGISTGQIESSLMKHRGQNRQPGGGLTGVGTSPSRRIRSRFVCGSATGTAESSALV